MNPELSSKFTLSNHKTVTIFVKRFHPQKHVVLQSTAPLQLKRFNPLPVQFKALLHGQKGCVFFSGHLNLCTAPETGLPSREKNHNN